MKKFTALIILLIVSLFISNVIYAGAAFKLTEEAVEFIAKSARKPDLKLIQGSIEVKAGAQFESAAGVTKMTEAAASRTPLKIVEALQKSAERAAPVEGKPGWVKTFVGAGVFLTGADIGYELLDAIEGVNPDYDPNKIQRYSEAFVAGTGDMMVGTNGLSYNWEYVTDRYGVTSAYLKVSSAVVTGAWWMVNNSGTNGGMDYQSYASATPFNKDAQVTSWLYRNSADLGDLIDLQISNAYGSGQAAYITLKISRWSGYYNSYAYPLVEGPIPGVSRVAAPEIQTVPMTDAFADAYPDDTELVPIIYPDPATVSDPAASIQENQDAIRDYSPSTDPETDPGTENPPNSDKINWEPLKLLPDTFTKKFPFSIPWDIARQLSVFDVSPQAPVLHVNKVIPVFGSTVNLKFDIDFSMFDTVAVIVRWFLIIAFDLGVILSIRKFMPE